MKKLPIIFLLIFATLQFFLLLRHKTPYLSDSYFYKQIFYEIKGDSYSIARQKIMNQVDLKNEDKIGKNIFLNEEMYKNVHVFFYKRPLYPLTAVLLNFIVNEYLAFLIPVYLAYLGFITLSYYLFSKNLSPIGAAISTALVISFYPFLDWATYFLTDTIGALFWLLQILFIYNYLTYYKNKWLFMYAEVLIISLLNREQSILMIPLTLTLIVISNFSTKIKNQNSKLKNIIAISLLIGAAYILISIFTKQRNIFDAIIYTENNYGLTNTSHSLSESLLFWLNSIKGAHLGFVKELLSHHWWFVITVLGGFSAINTFLIKKKWNLLELMLLLSGAFSYLAIYIYPVLSYRYFYPVLISLIYFFIKLIEDFYKEPTS